MNTQDVIKALREDTHLDPDAYHLIISSGGCLRMCFDYESCSVESRTLKAEIYAIKLLRMPCFKGFNIKHSDMFVSISIPQEHL